ncbi:hypothetical protein [Aquimarina celericrescens]|uniref:Uncharacterized protein n=1 Tax=Aquimarina celericrescens TaxID=1964542 RepID=A0ABW5B3X7_9FLAO|nr:hypothetical protein [Aquimarina celericrescens]
MKKKETNTLYDASITESDKQALGDKVQNVRNDGGRDDFLRNREKPVDFAGEDLDVPGRTLPKDSKNKLKDEENQLYSQGGSGNENLEQSSDF